MLTLVIKILYIIISGLTLFIFSVRKYEYDFNPKIWDNVC